MKHSVGDGRGRREVWLDGFLIERVIECDDELGTVVVSRFPYLFTGHAGDLVTDTLQGDTVVVQPIELSFWQM